MPYAPMMMRLSKTGSRGVYTMVIRDYGHAAGTDPVRLKATGRKGDLEKLAAMFAERHRSTVEELTGTTVTKAARHAYPY